MISITTNREKRFEKKLIGGAIIGMNQIDKKS